MFVCPPEGGVESAMVAVFHIGFYVLTILVPVGAVAMSFAVQILAWQNYMNSMKQNRI